MWLVFFSSRDIWYQSKFGNAMWLKGTTLQHEGPSENIKNLSGEDCDTQIVRI